MLVTHIFFSFSMMILEGFLKRGLLIMVLALYQANHGLNNLRKEAFNLFPNDKFWTTNLNELRINNFKFDENGTQIIERADNTVGTGEIAWYQQFLLFLQRFDSKTFTGDR